MGKSSVAAEVEECSESIKESVINSIDAMKKNLSKYYAVGKDEVIEMEGIKRSRAALAKADVVLLVLERNNTRPNTKNVTMLAISCPIIGVALILFFSPLFSIFTPVSSIHCFPNSAFEYQSVPITRLKTADMITAQIFT